MPDFHELVRDRAAAAESDPNKLENLRLRLLDNRLFVLAAQCHAAKTGADIVPTLLDLAVIQCQHDPSSPATEPDVRHPEPPGDAVDRHQVQPEDASPAHEQETAADAAIQQDADELLEGMDMQAVIVKAVEIVVAQLFKRIPGLQLKILESIMRKHGNLMNFLQCMEAGEDAIREAGAPARFAEPMAKVFADLGGIGGAIAEALAFLKKDAERGSELPQHAEQQVTGDIGKRMQLGSWSVETAGWDEKPMGLLQKVYYESKDGRRGLYVSVSPSHGDAQAELMAMLEYARRLEAQGMKLTHHHKGDREGLSLVVVDMYDAQAGYRIVQVSLSDGLTSLQLGLHDYRCQNPTEDDPEFTRVIGSMRRESKPGTSVSTSGVIPRRSTARSLGNVLGFIVVMVAAAFVVYFFSK